MATLVIFVTMDDDSDFDWIRNQVVPVVEEKVDEIKESGRLDSNLENVGVGWEQTDDAT